MCFDLKSVTLVIPLTLSQCLLLLSLLSSDIICSMRNYLQAKSIFAPIANEQAQKLVLIDVLDGHPPSPSPSPSLFLSLSLSLSLIMFNRTVEAILDNR